ncbi:MAG: response regulator [Gemmatimonadales bacterium]
MRLTQLAEELRRVLDGPLPTPGPRSGGARVGDRDHTGPRFRVLVVEDNKVNQQVATLMLTKLGHRVDVAGNGLEAVAAVQQFPYDVVFMDCQMPELDGFGATAEIRKLQGSRSRVPIIAMTANVMSGDLERCLAVGMDDYVSKPLIHATLVARLNRWGGAMQASPAEGDTMAAAGGDVLDPGVVGALLSLAGDSPGFFEDLVGLFLDDLTPRLDGVREGLAARQGGEVVRWAHSLRGSAANLGAVRLAALCGEIEVAARGGDIVAATAFAARLDAEAEQVRAALAEACHESA